MGTGGAGREFGEAILERARHGWIERHDPDVWYPRAAGHVAGQLSVWRLEGRWGEGVAWSQISNNGRHRHP